MQKLLNKTVTLIYISSKNGVSGSWVTHEPPPTLSTEQYYITKSQTEEPRHVQDRGSKNYCPIQPQGFTHEL